MPSTLSAQGALSEEKKGALSEEEKEALSEEENSPVSWRWGKQGMGDLFREHAVQHA
ncbi:hypothetical protein CLAM6_05360 [Cobetia sp. AM6]|nr:hypothetical protein CLAM6_05360 [Cobetia sp. AM6]